MKIIYTSLISFCFLLLFSCNQKKNITVDYASQQLFTLSNQIADNRLLIFKRNLDGTMEYDSSISLHGIGIGTTLGSANPLMASQDGNWLFAVNAGSNSITSIDIRGNIPQAISTISSNGVKPVSIAVYQNWLFVLNQGNNGNISGFTYDNNGVLSPLPNATAELGIAPVNPAQISFNANGNALIVTEKDSSKIDLIHLNTNGSISNIQKFATASPKPYGFARSDDDYIFCSEALQNNFSVYKIDNNSIDLASSPISTVQNGACWVGLLPNQHYAYMLHAGTNCVTGYDVSNRSNPQLLNSDGLTATTGLHPIEITFSQNSQHMFVLNTGSHSIHSFAINDNGSLTFVQEKTGLPSGAVGLALR